VPLIQNINFYYPNINDEKIYYKNVAVNFYTNDVTREKLAQAYKGEPVANTGKVFSENTQINSLYLNDDGMVYLDLNKAFLQEMNAGAGYEAMILQSIANTFGQYYNAEKVILTIEGKPYESGHIALQEGEYLQVNYDNVIEGS
jgi:spore germination protein GerM